ncbi:lantibiotic dehydratase [Streptomyces sp. NPDC057638]|uniref:lantibiotic dehydratase n=1 Tax=Streptomyces sp. NPDC057638 TaxID=3346190 RepID=UPI0036915170
MTETQIERAGASGAEPEGERPRTAAPPTPYGTALLRAAGMPSAAWAAAGSPALFARATAHLRARRCLADRARLLADLLGTSVVPHPALSTPHRQAVLALRRRLHSGAAPGDADCLLLEAADGVPVAVCQEARELRESDGRLTEEFAALDRATDEEWARVGALCWETVRAHPVMRVFLDSTAPELTETVERRLAHGASWSSNRLRKNSAFLWRALARAAVKTTPRDWVGQIVPVPIVAVGAAADGPDSPCPEARSASSPFPSPASSPSRSGPRHPDRAVNPPHPPHPSAPGPRRNGAPRPPTSAARLLTPGATLTAMAAEVSQNVHVLRARSGALDLTDAGPGTLIAPVPLHFGTAEASTGAPSPADDGAGQLRCGVVDPAHPGRLRQITLARTRPLDAVLARLAAGPRPVGEIETELLAGATGERADAARRALRGFLAHLHRLGVLEVCAPPRRIHGGWSAPGGPLPHPSPWLGEPGGAARAAGVPDDWFLDSYRRAEGGDRHPLTLPAAAVTAVHAGVRTAARLAALRRADHAEPVNPLNEATPHPYAPLRGIDERPRPLRDFLAFLEQPLAQGPDGRPLSVRIKPVYEGWHPARTPGSGYARLLELLGARLGDESGDIDDALLDAVGAPTARESMPSWPVDCLVRPLAGDGPLAVLETASAAGVLDARFADTLDTLGGGYDGTERHRAFLAAVERAADVRFVELLIPPLAERAANAVRRPRLTSWWTGDPDPAPYFGAIAPGAARYLPLDRITLRRDGTRIIAEADGGRIVPVHHATRTPMPPYDLLLRVLMAAHHPGTGDILRLDGLAGAFPQARRVPRLTVGGRLVVSPAAHRVPGPELWDPRWSGTGAEPRSDRDKVLRLAALRDAAGLPRFAFVRTRTDTPQTPVDFNALPTLRVLDRLRAQDSTADLLVEEALPAPGDHVLRDRAHPGDGNTIAAQLLLRTPLGHDTDTFDALVDVAVAALRG